MSKYFIVCIFMIVTTIVFCSCTIEQYIEYNDEIQAKYGDAIVVKTLSDAPITSEEFKNDKRVSCDILLDTRIIGRHITGLYLPKGEKLIANIDVSRINDGYEIVVIEGDSIHYIAIDKKNIEIETSVGASIEIKVNRTSGVTPKLNLSGAIVEPHYRYGLDVAKDSLVSNSGQFIYLDATNIRLVFPIKYKSLINQVEKTMFWWQNAVTLIDEVFNTSFYSRDYSAMTIEFVDELSNTIYNPDENSIKMNSQILNEVVSYELLSYDKNDVIFDVLKSICYLRNIQTYCFEETFIKDCIEDIITSLTFVNMLDSTIVSEDNSHYDVVNSVNVIRTFNNLNNEDFKTKIINIFMLQYFEKGEEYVVNLLKTLSNTTTTYEEFIIEHDYLLDHMNYVATDYTYGAFNQSSQTGTHVKLGEDYIFDFKSTIVSNREGWEIDSINGDDTLWTKIENGVYKYTPSKNKLRDTFSIKLINGDDERNLYGNITVDVDVCQYQLYSNVNYKSLNDAIKDSKSATPTKTQAIGKAEIIKEEEYNVNSRSFAKVSGCMQVDKTGFYKLYLASSGLCSVRFGVKEYYSEIFSNILTVSEYTDELCYEIKLQEGYVYYFDIYNLADKGYGFAKLGIQLDNGQIFDIDNEYIISESLTRKDVVEYESINRNIDSICMQELIYKTIGIAKIYDSTQRQIALGETIKLCNANTIEQVFVNLETRAEIQYIDLTVPSQMSGITLNIRLASTDEVLKSATLKSGRNYLEIDSIYAEKIKLEFASSKAYALEIDNINFGYFIDSMPIIPGTSREIEYIGQWYTSHDYVSMNGSLAISDSKSAKASYKFNGDQISIYATKGKEFGTATIYIDDKAICAVDLNSMETQSSQLIYSAKLSEGDHVVVIEANGDSSINIDYFSVHILGKTVVKNNFSKIWFVLFIPVLVIVGAIVSISLDIITKKKQKAK